MYGFLGPSWSIDADKNEAIVCDNAGKNGGNSSKVEELSFLRVSSSTN